MSEFELNDSLLGHLHGEGDTPTGIAVAFSTGIRKIRHLSRFLGVAAVVGPAHALFSRMPVSCVVVWGRKQNSWQALNYARKRQLPVLYVEDGWIRSSSANPHSRVSYSLLIDDTGVYYDSSEPSALEQYLNLTDEIFDQRCGEVELAYAADCRRLMIEHNVTKYNYCKLPEEADLRLDDRPIVLVLDQTLDDASVRFGGMDAHSFDAMLDRAVRENPEARIIVRTHPDVVKGRRQGYLHENAKALGIEVSATADNPIAWLKRSSIVYVGTSQLGYEALLCGCTVKVAGQPFYAGWGLTEDWQPVTRRVRRRTLDQLFHATHVHHAQYRCPVTGSPWTLRDCLDHVRLQQSYFARNAGKRVCIGITPWKRKYISQFLCSPYAQLRFSARNDAAADETPVYWSFTGSDEQLEKTESPRKSKNYRMQVLEKCIRVEDGFLRSKGLGSDFVAPTSLVFDDVGLYFDATRVSSLENLLNTYQCTADELARARRLREKIVNTNLTKYNVVSLPKNSQSCRTLANGRKSILVVGQVEGDQSILRGSFNVCTNSKLLVAARNSNPDAFIVFKPHPDVISGNRKGQVDLAILEVNADVVEKSKSFLDCLTECDELHTITSLSGFEAILRGKRVVTYGMPFYAGWGLTEDTRRCSRRRIKRSLDELVFLSLIIYPYYVDLLTGDFVTVEQVIEKLGNLPVDNSAIEKIQWIQKISNVYAALTYRC